MRTKESTMNHAAATVAAVLISVCPASVAQALAQETPAPAPGQPVTLVTGATSGLGRELALRLGARGDHVIVHGRNEERGAAVVAAINAAGPGSARFYRADFASLGEVRQFAETLLADYDRMDILINNAGFGSAPDERWVTEDGHEYRFQVNYLSTFLLTHMLMPRLLDSTPSRIVNVSSGAQAPIDFDDVMIENDFSGRRAYAQSKLAQIMFTHDLAEELAGTASWSAHSTRRPTCRPRWCGGWGRRRAPRSPRGPTPSCRSSIPTISRAGSTSADSLRPARTPRPTTRTRVPASGS